MITLLNVDYNRWDYGRTDIMNIVQSEYNKYHNTIDINYYNGYILRIDCGKTEDGLITTPNSQRMLDALAIDDPLEYASTLS